MDQTTMYDLQPNHHAFNLDFSKFLVEGHPVHVDKLWIEHLVITIPRLGSMYGARQMCV